MLNEFKINNFKSFGTEQKISLKPITLIYGPNSSGKSSILQSLLLQKQTVELSEDPEILLSPKGNLVDLGGYREFINGHDVKKSFTFGLKFPAERRLMRPSLRNSFDIKADDSIGLEITLSYHEETSSAILNEVNLFVGNGNEPIISLKAGNLPADSRPLRRSISMMMSGRRGGRTVLKIQHVNQNHPIVKDLWNKMRILIDTEVLPQIKNRRQILQGRLADYTQANLPGIIEKSRLATERRLTKELKIVNEAEQKLLSYSMLDAIRDAESFSQDNYIQCSNFLPIEISRSIARFDSQKASIDYLSPISESGLMSLPALLIQVGRIFASVLEDIVYIGPLRDYPARHYVFSGNSSEQVGKSGRMVPDVLFKRPTLLQKVNKQLELFGLGYELKVASAAGDESELQDIFSLRLLDKSTGIHSSILDVGFGISQVLPIIVQSMLSSQKTLCIEQPEIHLHPKLQADLGSLFVECSKAPYNNQFIVETHSQHLILRIQRLIRLGQISSEDVSVIYVNRTEEGSVCLSLRLDKDGDFIDEWPNGFFEEGYNEIFN